MSRGGPEGLANGSASGERFSAIFSPALWKAVGLIHQPLNVSRDKYFSDEPLFYGRTSAASGMTSSSSYDSVVGAAGGAREQPTSVVGGAKRRRVESPRCEDDHERIVSAEDLFYAGTRTAPSLEAISAAPRRARSGGSRRRSTAAALASLASSLQLSSNGGSNVCSAAANWPGTVLRSASQQQHTPQQHHHHVQQQRLVQQQQQRDNGSGTGGEDSSHGGLTRPAAAAAGTPITTPPTAAQEARAQPQHMPWQLSAEPCREAPSRLAELLKATDAVKASAKAEPGDGSPVSHSTESSQERVFGTSASPFHDGSGGNSAPESKPTWAHSSPIAADDAD
uniref:Uncharacterized protein n=1 Tax=Chlamydomonas euryale TaxID=1486919 RepID=A0A7R9VJC9_9CHLO|mmetsp:Transcript_36647/g.108113  ORF Transcript_36647/g.108113 Transcript_36647/m.108113 type:complete len:338 (+) Transcript_36647:196-1209(+)